MNGMKGTNECLRDDGDEGDGRTCKEPYKILGTSSIPGTLYRPQGFDDGINENANLHTDCIPQMPQGLMTIIYIPSVFLLTSQF